MRTRRTKLAECAVREPLDEEAIARIEAEWAAGPTAKKEDGRRVMGDVTAL